MSWQGPGRRCRCRPAGGAAARHGPRSGAVLPAASGACCVGSVGGEEGGLRRAAARQDPRINLERQAAPAARGERHADKVSSRRPARVFSTAAPPAAQPAAHQSWLLPLSTYESLAPVSRMRVQAWAPWAWSSRRAAAATARPSAREAMAAAAPSLCTQEDLGASESPWASQHLAACRQAHPRAGRSPLRPPVKPTAGLLSQREALCLPLPPEQQQGLTTAHTRKYGSGHTLIGACKLLQLTSGTHLGVMGGRMGRIVEGEAWKGQM